MRSRILKRPMFKMGGSTENVGIMNGMRARYEKGTGNQGAQKRDVLATPGLSPFLIDFGLNLLSATPRGNIFATAGAAAQDPFRRFQERQIAAQTIASDRAFKEKLLERELEGRKEIAEIQARKSGDKEKQALVKGYMAQYSGDANAYQKAVNRAEFDLGIRDSLQLQYPDDIIAGVVDFDITDVKQAKSFAKASKNKVGQIFYDINTRTPYRLVEVGGELSFQKLTGDKEGDALPEPEPVESFPGEFSDNPSYRRKPKPGFTIPPKGAFEDPVA